jgi:tRNA pseudouridine55 synthase
MIPILQKNSRSKASELYEGFIVLINKEGNWTSFDVVRKIRNFTGIKKVGHSGTLDPFATGLMIIGAGKGTKMLTGFLGKPKSYRARIQFGLETDTFDRTGETVRTVDAFEISEKTIIEAISKLTGKIFQIPPMFSAKKKGGKPLYKLARKGIAIEREPVPVEIKTAKILSWKSPYLDLELEVSKGTYVRTYAHDLGKLTGVGAILCSLHRFMIDLYRVEDSYTVEEFQSWWKKVLI